MQIENKLTEQSAFLSDGFSGKRFGKRRLENFVAKCPLLLTMRDWMIEYQRLSTDC